MSETPAEIVAQHLSDSPGWVELGRAEKIIAALAAAGYKILPREPTEAMRDAANEPMAEVDHGLQIAFIHGFKLPQHPEGFPVQRAYRAMWDAAS